MSPLSKKDVEKLLTEFQLLHLVYHRSANQHRSSLWWKHFNILHRKVRQILNLSIDVEQLEEENTSIKVTSNRGKVQVLSEKKVGQQRKQELKEKKEMQMTALAKYLVNSLLPDCYFRFFGVIELGQFIGLGFVLIGLVARIYSILNKIESVTVKNKKLEAKIQESKDLIATYKDDGLIDEEIGEIVSIEDLESHGASNSEDAQAKPKKRKLDVLDLEPNADTSIIKNKPKKSKSVMDDIFGTSKEKVKKKKKKSKSAMSDIFGF